MDRSVEDLPQTMQVDMSLISIPDLINLRRSLLGTLRMVELALAQQGLTFPRKEHKR